MLRDRHEILFINVVKGNQTDLLLVLLEGDQTSFREYLNKLSGNTKTTERINIFKNKLDIELCEMTIITFHNNNWYTLRGIIME